MRRRCHLKSPREKNEDEPMKPINLICVGFGKSGTTFLDHFIRQYTNFIPTVSGKEINFFQRKMVNLDAYLKEFDTSNLTTDSLPVFFEASPTYVTGKNNIAIREVFTKMTHILPNPKIIFCLRDPVYRAYSQYVHDLQRYALFGRGRDQPGDDATQYLLRWPYTNSFRQALILDSNVYCTYAAAIEEAFDVFGPQNVEFFFLEWDTEYPEALVNRIETFLQLPKIWKSLVAHGPQEPIFEGLPFPAYYFCSSLVEQEFPELYSPDLDRGELLIATGGGCALLRDLPEHVLARMVYACSAWTKSISAGEFDLAHRFFFREPLYELQRLLAGRGYDDRLEGYLARKTRGKEIERMPCTPEKAVDLLTAA
jgi:hypothetical protein